MSGLFEGCVRFFNGSLGNLVSGLFEGCVRFVIGHRVTLCLVFLGVSFVWSKKWAVILCGLFSFGLLQCEIKCRVCLCSAL